MNGYEIKRELQQSDTQTHCFIKWWRKQSEFADYQLVTQFLDSLKDEHEIEGYKLLSKEEMWNELKRRSPSQLTLDTKNGEKIIRWEHENDEGKIKEKTYPFSPEAVMEVFDNVTQGDTHI